MHFESVDVDATIEGRKDDAIARVLLTMPNPTPELSYHRQNRGEPGYMGITRKWKETTCPAQCKT